MFKTKRAKLILANKGYQMFSLLTLLELVNICREYNTLFWAVFIISYDIKGSKTQPCQNVPVANNFATFSQFLAAYSTLDFTGSALAGKGTW